MILLRRPSKYVWTFGFLFLLLAGGLGLPREFKFGIVFFGTFLVLPIVLTMFSLYVYDDGTGPQKKIEGQEDVKGSEGKVEKAETGSAPQAPGITLKDAQSATSELELRERATNVTS